MADEMNNPKMPYSEFYKVESVMLDMIQQFKNGRVTKAITDALDAQMEELRQAFYSIVAYVNLDCAEGEILDAIGSILNLTRADAALLVSSETSILMDDDSYRRYLKYKALQGTGQGTYQDIINEIKTVLGDDFNIMFEEDSTTPATVIIEIGSSEEGHVDIDKLPILKPAGVELDYSKSPYLTEIHISEDTDPYYTTGVGISCGMIHRAGNADAKYGIYGKVWRCGQYPKLYAEEYAEDGNVYGYVKEGE